MLDNLEKIQEHQEAESDESGGSDDTQEGELDESESPNPSAVEEPPDPIASIASDDQNLRNSKVSFVHKCK